MLNFNYDYELRAQLSELRMESKKLGYELKRDIAENKWRIEMVCKEFSDKLNAICNHLNITIKQNDEKYKIEQG